MKAISFWFDPVSPFAYLAFERLPQALEGCSYAVEYKPVLFAGLLKQHGQKGPAEIEPKRQWTFRHVQWLARELGIPMQMPARHPFNPLPLLRLIVACGANRWVVETVFRHVWREGGDPGDAQRLAALTAQLAPDRDPAGDDVKAELRALSDEALVAGLFGVPTVTCASRLFWGLDALPMVAQALRDDPWFDGPWKHAGRAVPGLQRKT